MRIDTVIIPQPGEYVNKGSGEGLQFTEIVICWLKYPGGCPMKKYIAVMLTLVLLSNLDIIGLLFQNNRLPLYRAGGFAASHNNAHMWENGIGRD